MSFEKDRREFLKAAAVAAVTIAPGLVLIAPAEATAKPADQPASPKVRWGLLVDSTKCTADCTACVSACRTENGLAGFGRPKTDPQWIRKVELKDKATGQVSSLPMMCQHCGEPPCVDVCPTGASFKRPDGIVLVDRHVCIGCRYCMMACPYKARSFVHEELEHQTNAAPRGMGTVEACNLCVGRVDAGQNPACVDACRSNGKAALLFGDLNDPNSEIAKRVKSAVQLRPDLKTNNGVRYQGI
jgi:molybdopterin-containing oxidoreductase family iron-sulfur binding subunit